MDPEGSAEVHSAGEFIGFALIIVVNHKSLKISQSLILLENIRQLYIIINVIIYCQLFNAKR